MIRTHDIVYMCIHTLCTHCTHTQIKMGCVCPCNVHTMKMIIEISSTECALSPAYFCCFSSCRFWAEIHIPCNNIMEILLLCTSLNRFSVSPQWIYKVNLQSSTIVQSRQSSSGSEFPHISNNVVSPHHSDLHGRNTINYQQFSEALVADDERAFSLKTSITNCWTPHTIWLN